MYSNYSNVRKQWDIDFSGLLFLLEKTVYGYNENKKLILYIYL